MQEKRIIDFLNGNLEWPSDEELSGVTIYLAGPLFGVSDISHNLWLKFFLVFNYRCRVILPQIESQKFVADGKLDLVAVRQDCIKHSADPDVIVVMNTDGRDDGTAYEGGIAWGVGKISVSCGTDIRTNEENEIFKNAMIQEGEGIIGVDLPCSIRNEGDIIPFYEKLTQMIYEAVLRARNN